eukprot:1140483-Pelagomonas_calceolata.AAC.3
MTWMAGMRCACSAWTGHTRKLSNPHSLALPTHDDTTVKVEPKGRYDCSYCDCALARCQILKGYL